MTPARGIRFIHIALRREVADLERAVHAAADVRALAERVAFFGRVAELHNRGEEVGLFPPVAERLPGTEALYLREHAEEQADVAALASAVGAGDVVEARRLASHVREHLHTHIDREDEVLTPLIERTFTPAEQGAHIGAMMSVFAPQDFALILPWLVKWLDPADRVAYLAMLRIAVPPERFAGMTGLLRVGLPEGVRSELAAHVPELA